MSSCLDSPCLSMCSLQHRKTSENIRITSVSYITGLCGKGKKSMPPEPISPGSPEDWLRYAKADLALARVPLPVGGLYALLCFHTQQAVEKSLKAVLIHHGI